MKFTFQARDPLLIPEKAETTCQHQFSGFGGTAQPTMNRNDHAWSGLMFRIQSTASTLLIWGDKHDVNGYLLIKIKAKSFFGSLSHSFPLVPYELTCGLNLLFDGILRSFKKV